MPRLPTDLDELEKEREEAAIDKADLFDFYNGYWNGLVTELKKLRTQREMLDASIEARTLKKICAHLYGYERGIDHSIIAELEEGECLKKK